LAQVVVRGLLVRTGARGGVNRLVAASGAVHVALGPLVLVALAVDRLDPDFFDVLPPNPAVLLEPVHGLHRRHGRARDLLQPPVAQVGLDAGAPVRQVRDRTPTAGRQVVLEQDVLGEGGYPAQRVGLHRHPPQDVVGLLFERDGRLGAVGAVALAHHHPAQGIQHVGQRDAAGRSEVPRRRDQPPLRIVTVPRGRPVFVDHALQAATVVVVRPRQARQHIGHHAAPARGVARRIADAGVGQQDAVTSAPNHLRGDRACPAQVVHHRFGLRAGDDSG